MGGLFSRSRASVGSLPIAQRVVVITGCDTGFGHDTAVHMDQLGYIVVAGCLTEQGREALRARLSPRSVATLYDVTKEADHMRVADEVAQQYPQGVYAIVCNAGLAAEGPAEWVDISSVRKVMEVNYFGVVATVKSFLPGVHKTRGRIVIIASLAARIAAPYMSSYSASKHAVAAYSDALRREMAPFGIKVVTIEPGFMKTNIIKSSPLGPLWDKQPPEVKKRYGDGFVAASDKITNDTYKNADDPKKVVMAIAHAVHGRSPNARQLVGYDTFVLGVIVPMLPVPWIDWLVSLVATIHPPAI